MLTPVILDSLALRLFAPLPFDNYIFFVWRTISLRLCDPLILGLFHYFTITFSMSISVVWDPDNSNSFLWFRLIEWARLQNGVMPPLTRGSRLQTHYSTELNSQTLYHTENHWTALSWTDILKLDCLVYTVHCTLYRRKYWRKKSHEMGDNILCNFSVCRKK